MEKEKKWQVLLDLLVLISVALPLLLLTQLARPYNRGFFTHDDSIRLPYLHQTVTEVTLGCLGFAINIAAVLVMEFLQNRSDKNLNRKYLFGFSVPAWAWESYATIRTFTFGALCQQLVANVTKYVTGRLRPHFIDVCRPMFNETASANSLGYIQDYLCTDPFDHRLHDSRLSFFSAHSSFAMYAAVFLVIYIQAKGRWRGSKLLRHVVQFFVMLGAWYVGLTRVVENFHHWSDVCAGFLNGAIFGLLVVIYVLKPTRHLPMTWQDTVRPETSLPVAR